MGLLLGLPGLLESEDTEPLPGPCRRALGPLGASLLLPGVARGLRLQQASPSESTRARGCWLMATRLPAFPGLGCCCSLRRPSMSIPAQEPTTHFMHVAAIPAGPGPSGTCGDRTCAGVLSSAGALPRGLPLPDFS